MDHDELCAYLYIVGECFTIHQDPGACRWTVKSIGLDVYTNGHMWQVSCLDNHSWGPWMTREEAVTKVMEATANGPR